MNSVEQKQLNQLQALVAQQAQAQSQHAAAMEENSKMTREIHDAFFDVPPGSPKDEKPLIEQIRVVTRAYDRSKWAVRIIIGFIVGLAAFGGAIKTIMSWGSNP